MTLEEMARAIAVLEARLASIERQLTMMREVLSRSVFVPAGRPAPPRQDV